jgi:hypothetical protein
MEQLVEQAVQTLEAARLDAENRVMLVFFFFLFLLVVQQIHPELFYFLFTVSFVASKIPLCESSSSD